MSEEKIIVPEVTPEVTLEVETVADSSDKKTAKVVKVKFLLSPTGKFNLAYNVGEIAKINALQANELVDAGYAELV